MTSLPAALPEIVTVHGLGLTVLDQQLFLKEYPAADSKVFAEDSRTQLGGPVPTALAQLRRFDVSCRLLSVWGDDTVGREIESELIRSEIDFEPHLCRSAPRSGIAHVWVEPATGRRTVASLRPLGEPDALAAAEFGRTASVLHLDGWGGNAALSAATAASGPTTLITLDSGSVKPTTERLLSLAAVVNIPLHQLRGLCGTNDPRDGASRLLDLGPQLVTVTDGDRGAGIYTHDFTEWLPAFPVRAVDTCGAGDVFCGGLIYATVTGMEPRDALRFAMATAALKITRPGNRESLPDWAQVKYFLAEHAE